MPVLNRSKPDPPGAWRRFAAPEPKQRGLPGPTVAKERISRGRPRLCGLASPAAEPSIRKRLRALHAKTLTVETIFRGVTTVRRVIYAQHTALARDHGWPATGGLEFLFCSTARYACARAVEAILGWIAFVMGIVHARHTPGTLDDTGSAARQLFRSATGFCL